MSDLAENKVPLAFAADAFAKVCASIDDGKLNETILALFNETRLDLSAAVDRRLCFLQIIGASIQAAKDARDSWKQRVDQLEHIEKRVKELTMQVMQQQQSIEYKGETGKLCLQNSPKALKLNFPTYAKTFTGIITEDDITQHKVDAAYVQTITAYRLDSGKVKEELDAGRELPFASLTQGQHLRIRV